MTPSLILRCVNYPQVCWLPETNLVVQARTFRIRQYNLKIRLDAFEINAGACYRPSGPRSAHKYVYTTIGLSPNLGSLNPVSIEYHITVSCW
jgi:hypothetical protein